MPQPKWGQIRDFCRRLGYAEDDDGSHIHYDAVLADGSSSWTMVSHGQDSVQVPKNLWTQIWRHQLRLRSEEEFWRGLRGETVAYDIPPTPEPTRPLPDYLARFLRDVLHLPQEEIATLTREEAQRRLDAHYAHAFRDDDAP